MKNSLFSDKMWRGAGKRTMQQPATRGRVPRERQADEKRGIMSDVYLIERGHVGPSGVSISRIKST